jgi:secreted PhoX family phosphatase
VHEAVAVDPRTGIVYLTEDRGAAGLYRFLPAHPGQLALGGRLQMLAIRGSPGYDTRTAQRQLEELRVTWVEIGDPDPVDAELDASLVFLQGSIAGGATFGRLEGAWYGNGRIYVNSTSGGDARLGQVWEYRPGKDGGRLRLLFESPSADVLQSPDNVCVSPRGTGLVLCEDGAGEQFVRGLTREGKVFDFARNMIPGAETNEFAGATFSPDQQTLFVNVQTPGITFAIWGPWKRGAL